MGEHHKSHNDHGDDKSKHEDGNNTGVSRSRGPLCGPRYTELLCVWGRLKRYSNAGFRNPLNPKPSTPNRANAYSAGWLPLRKNFVLMLAIRRCGTNIYGYKDPMRVTQWSQCPYSEGWGSSLSGKSHLGMLNVKEALWLRRMHAPFRSHA